MFKISGGAMRGVWLFLAHTLTFCSLAQAAEQYTISGEFQGCEYGKLYELDGGGVLECQEYKYFYEYRPIVIASGREVIVIGNEKVSAYLHDGSVFTTHVADEFDGCDNDKIYKLDNGILFQCNTYHYHYAYRPEVKIFVIKGRTPIVFIDGEQYNGTLLKAN
ncbi:hypothetical protein D3227_21230 [Mesorhizobium waimense]|uniref:Uncharacterized protein n=1 Tax=Mesorhizobium waimense TaxID=1300307 RepID=A0A3A5KK29_9HYPH|nr:hypothetical protein [Mesorhizobium waimense]RJT36224.1 hypothetical protein D3227_21230 [Mesorhizobium waimense]